MSRKAGYGRKNDVCGHLSRKHNSHGMCKNCCLKTPKSTKAAKEWAQNNPEKRRAYVKQWRLSHPAHSILRTSQSNAEKKDHIPIGHGLPYDIAVALIQTRLDKKPAACECCGESKKLALDHDHVKQGDNIRGWLCLRCNTFIGHIERGLDIKAKAYLDRTSK